MGKRSIRVNELIKREISTILHTTYQAEAVYISITEVEVSPDLRNGRVYYSVIGDDNIASAKRLLNRVGSEINRLVGNNVILKYTPKLRFIYDDSIKQGMQTIDIIHELDEEDQ